MATAQQAIRDFLQALDKGFFGEMPPLFHQSAFVAALRAAAQEDGDNALVALRRLETLFKAHLIATDESMTVDKMEKIMDIGMPMPIDALAYRPPSANIERLRSALKDPRTNMEQVREIIDDIKSPAP